MAAKPNKTPQRNTPYRAYVGTVAMVSARPAKLTPIAIERLVTRANNATELRRAMGLKGAGAYKIHSFLADAKVRSSRVATIHSTRGFRGNAAAGGASAGI